MLLQYFYQIPALDTHSQHHHTFSGMLLIKCTIWIYYRHMCMYCQSDLMYHMLCLT